jgi:tetratricopeptide (TPR) repeat protein
MDETWLEKIEDYINGTMSEEERSLFEIELATNEQLASTYNIYKAIETDMRSSIAAEMQDAALKSTLEKLNAKYFLSAEQDNEAEADDRKKATGSRLSVEKKTGELTAVPNARRQSGDTRKIALWKKIAIAAVLIGVIASGVNYFLNKEERVKNIAANSKSSNKNNPATRGKNSDTSAAHQNVSSSVAVTRDDKSDSNRNNKKKEAGNNFNDLFANNFKPDAPPDDKPDLLEDAFDYYENKRYKQAIEAFENTDLNTVTRGESIDKKLLTFYIDYYEGISYMRQDNMAKAITKLELANKESVGNNFKTKNVWYLGLAYLKTGNSDKAKRCFNQVAAEKDEALKKKAIKLIKQLNEK